MTSFRSVLPKCNGNLIGKGSPGYQSLLIGTTLVLGFVGCRGMRPLVFTTGTVIGVEATAEEGVEQHFVFGLKRFEGALVPTVYCFARDTAATESATGAESTGAVGGDDRADVECEVRGEAYSVFAALGLSTGLLKPTRIVQVFGTGEAANTLAGSPAAISNIIGEAVGMEVTFNADPVAKGFRDRIQGWVDDPITGDANWEALGAYLESIGEKSITLWLASASAAELAAGLDEVRLVEP